jgi:hypothetical protein
MLTVVAQEMLGERDYQSPSVSANSQSCPEPTTLLLNRELSLLRFYERFLEEALDQSNPLLGRFLEHSHVFYFANGDDEEEIYLGDQSFDAQHYFVSGKRKENADHASTI